jgi:uncharacterized damage-inducible protein DinB
MVPERVRKYALEALSATPPVLARLLDGLTDAEADRRPDPERFTIREALAHVADWEPIWLERLTALAERDNPTVPGYDEGQFAIDRDYAHADIAEQLARVTEGRARLVEYVARVPRESWDRPGVHGEIGPLTFHDLVTLILAHDGYHLKQMVEFRP